MTLIVWQKGGNAWQGEVSQYVKQQHATVVKEKEDETNRGGTIEVKGLKLITFEHLFD